jgi:hypothetical protein
MGSIPSTALFTARILGLCGFLQVNTVRLGVGGNYNQVIATPISNVSFARFCFQTSLCQQRPSCRWRRRNRVFIGIHHHKISVILLAPPKNASFLHQGAASARTSRTIRDSRSARSQTALQTAVLVARNKDVVWLRAWLPELQKCYE